MLDHNIFVLGKKSFDDTVKELIKLIHDDKQQQDSDKNKEIKPSTNLPSQSPTVIENKPVENTNNQTTTTTTKPIDDNDKEPIRNSIKKPVEQWTKKDIIQWFDDNYIHQELIDLYDFRHGTHLLLYGQCLRPDWQIEYNDMRERYQQKYNTQLYRDQFVRLVSAIASITAIKTAVKVMCNLLKSI